MPEPISARVTIPNKYGLHARPATSFAAAAETFACDVLVRQGDVDADGKSIMELMMLAATKGTEIEIVCNGEDGPACLEVLADLVRRGFDEED
ncbi:MAG: HPr family phosphocarrier protein [Phycisphaerales bacterium]|nr:HPr family phosphocarrier protein [Phycisphaerales bacterium]